jgi:DNA-binding GntR family transcriptional regulator
MGTVVKAASRMPEIGLNTLPNVEITTISLADTLAEQAYADLSKMIHKREFKGGQQLVELRLAKQLGISRTPIRQALRRLEGEGLLQKSGSRHYFVRRVELQEYLHSLKVREILEAEAAFTAANNVSETDIKKARKNLKMVETQNPYSMLSHWQSDEEVHGLFIDACPNRVLRKVIRSLRATTKLFEIENLAERLEPDSRQHESILTSLLSRDKEASKASVQFHIKSLYKFALRVL